jgi:hypothetical protein
VQNFVLLDHLIIANTGKCIRFENIESGIRYNTIEYSKRATRIRNDGHLLTVSGAELDVYDLDEKVYSFPFEFHDHLLKDNMVYGWDRTTKLCDLRVGICTSEIIFPVVQIDLVDNYLICTNGTETRLYDVRNHQRYICLEVNLFSKCSIVDLKIIPNGTKCFLKWVDKSRNCAGVVEYDLLTGLQNNIEWNNVPILVDNNFYYVVDGTSIFLFDKHLNLFQELRGHLETVNYASIMNSDLFSCSQHGVIMWEPKYTNKKVLQDDWS